MEIIQHNAKKRSRKIPSRNGRHIIDRRIQCDATMIFQFIEKPHAMRLIHDKDLFAEGAFFLLPSSFFHKFIYWATKSQA